jgi:L-fuculose-phosphate aldolase
MEAIMNVHAATPAGLPAGDLEALKQDFVTACRILVNEGVSEAAFNVSVRLPGDRMLTMPVTSPTLVSLANLEILPIAIDATVWKVHPAVYLERPDVNAIVHVHPPYAVAFSTLGEEFQPLHHYGAPFHGRMTTHHSPGQTETPDRARDIARQLGSHRLVLQQGHGTIAVGKDLKEALLLTLYFEEACRIFAIARQMGGTPQYLTPEQPETISGQILKQRSQDKGWAHYADKLNFRK